MFDTDVDYKSLIQGCTGVQHKTATPETIEFPALLHIKSVDVKRRRITALASTGNIDRQDEIILPEAFKEYLPVYMSNPIVLAAHQHRLETGQSPVVANIVKADIADKGLLVVLEFHDITDIAEEYWQLYSQKKQRALSVGFISHEGGYEEIDGRRIYVHKKVELLEVSCVAVPSNRDALTRSKQKKHDWLEEKKQEERAEEFSAILLGVKKTGIPIVDDPAAEGDFTDDALDLEESCELDCAGIIKGTACGEYAALIRRQ